MAGEGNSDLLQQILSQDLAKSSRSCLWQQVGPGEVADSYKISKMILGENYIFIAFPIGQIRAYHYICQTYILKVYIWTYMDMVWG